jgi:alpha-tubulin suppressor-like RCC1 family protein
LSGARGAAAASVLAAALASACIGPGDFHCTEHAQCTVGPAPGFCEANGRCSAASDSCLPSHRRYVHRAGSDADACVPAACDGKPVDGFSAGGGHACLVRDKRLWCWGRNDHGQLGDGTRTPRALPVLITAVSDVSAVAAGDAHTCAATKAGVFCWGADGAGQLGDGGGSDHGVPIQVPGVTAAGGPTVLAAGRDFSCVVVAGGDVSCWGDDSAGQLGDGGAPAGPHVPAVVAGLSNVSSLSALWQHACGLSTSGLLTCWGANDRGQIGDGSTAGPRPPTLVNDPAAPTPLPMFRQVATGSAHTCALSANDVYCWGDNGQGQIDQMGSNLPIPTPEAVAGVTDPNGLAAGAQHTCVVSTGGDVSCWGSNASGQRDGMMSNAVAIYAGANLSCAVGEDAALFCWGDNHTGQLAIGSEIIRATPAQVPGLAHVGALAAGGAHNCATADDADGARALFCWGADGSGQLGNGSLVDAPAPARLPALQPTIIAAGSAHTCAVQADRQLRCWGSGAAGQLGLNPGLDMVITTPTLRDLAPPEGGDGVFAVAAGAQHTCVAATISTSVLCFGLDADGQLGDGQQASGGPDPVPSFLASTGKIEALAAGDAHTCVIDAKSAIWCWGRNSDGQLGDGTGMERASPTAVMLGDGTAAADAIAAGAAHTCALAGGKVLCWGRNADGQLGASRPVPLLAPQAVAGLEQVRAVATGGRHTCAIDGDATVSCWGANESGQLGNGGTASSNTPVPVAGLTGVDGIVAGGAHSCAHRSDGTVWCWGANTSGQLGDDVTLTSPRPLLARIACD